MFELSAFETLFALLIGHSLADYPLQGRFIATYKSRHSKNPNEPESHPWWLFLTTHALVHAGTVWIVTGNVFFALIELVLHWIIDFVKAENRFSLITDQALHVLCKVGYFIAIFLGV